MTLINSKPIGHRLVLLSIAVLSLQVSGFAQKGPAFFEAAGFSGGLFKPSGLRTTGFGLGFGKGKNAWSVELTRDFMGDYEMGVGHVATTRNAIVESLSGKYRRDLFGSGRLTTYGLFGVGYVRSHSTGTSYLALLTAFPNDGAFLKQVYSVPDILSIPVDHRASTVGVAFGGGIRIPISRGIGIRAEFSANETGPADSSYSQALTPLRDPNGNAIVVSGFAYRVGGKTSPGPRLKSDSLLGATFGVYYRRLQRHL